MLPLKQTIEDGDLVVIYFTPQLSYAVTVHAGEAFNCRQGYFKWDDCIGRKFGCSVSGR